jgi:hypothetical protein
MQVDLAALKDLAKWGVGGVAASALWAILLAASVDQRPTSPESSTSSIVSSAQCGLGGRLMASAAFRRGGQ